MSSHDGASFGYGSPRAGVAAAPARSVRSLDWTRLALVHLLRRVVRTGRLVVRLAEAEPIVVGDGSGAEADTVTIRLREARTARRLVLSPELALGETYMDGDLVVEGGEIGDLLDLLARNVATGPRRRTGQAARLWARLRERIAQANDRLAARRNVAHHYDLSLELYRRFLDEDLQYSCAYFARPDMTLDEAQAAKKRHIAAKLLLRPGQRVLDIGCGWGGLALSLAEEAGVSVTGITLSREQLATARSRAQARGLDGQVDFRFEDYRDVQGTFDRIVSVGMFEHVGAPNYQAYFDGVARLLADDGVALIHAIGVTNRRGATQPWIAKYIFPGGHVPALSQVLPAIERAGLWVTDVEILRLHYAETLKAWRARFAARRDEIAALYDERFCRMWEFYLNLSEVGFRRRGCMVFQIQVAKRVDAVPLVRDYMAA